MFLERRNQINSGVDSESQIVHGNLLVKLVSRCCTRGDSEEVHVDYI